MLTEARTVPAMADMDFDIGVLVDPDLDTTLVLWDDFLDVGGKAIDTGPLSQDIDGDGVDDGVTVDEIVVTGVRTPNQSQLPEIVVIGDRPSGGDNSGGGSSGGSPTGTDGEAPERDCGPDDQAREALQRFLDDAALRGEFFGNRERGAFIVRNDDGSYRLVNLEVGPSVFSSEGATVNINSAGITPWNLVGYVQNHPSSGTLSGPDRDIISIYQNFLRDNGVNREFRMYLITNDERINVFDLDNMNSETGTDVTEPCS